MMDIIIYFLHHTVQDRYSEKDITLESTTRRPSNFAKAIKHCSDDQRGWPRTAAGWGKNRY